jgi:hypothetical protein
MQSFERCKLQLYNLYQDQPLLRYNFRDLSTQAWGIENKADCLDQFGSVEAAQAFLLKPGDISLLKEIVTTAEHNVATNT